MFFETTIMGNTADLAMVQKTIIDTPHKGKTQRVITERVAVHRVLYQSILNAKLTGRKKLGRKCAQATGMTASLRIQSSKAVSNTRESFTRSELKLESVHQESPAQTSSGKELPSHFWNRKHRQHHLTWAKEIKNWTVAQWSKVLFSNECNFAFHVEIKVPESGGRLERHRNHVAWSQCEVSTVSDDLGCHVICWCWSTVFSEVRSQSSHLPGHFRALHGSFCWPALWRCWFHFPAEFGTCPLC